MLNIYFLFMVVIVLIRLFFFLEKRLEKFCLSKFSKVRGRSIENRSRKLFKTVLLICQFAAAIEILCHHGKLAYNVYFFSFAIISVGLRIAAIRELKEMWSFNVELKYKHYLVQSGIYRFLNHPGYIGNAYIPFFFLSIGATNTSLFTSLCLAGFYVYRTSYENAIINKLRSKHNKQHATISCHEPYIVSALCSKVDQ